MAKLKTYNFDVLTVFLIILFLFGCVHIRKKSENIVQIINGNSVTFTTNEFKLTKLTDKAGFDLLPKELSNYQTQMGHFDFYNAQSPTQTTGGFFFEVVQNSNAVVICLRKPDPLSEVTASLTNPIAIVKIEKNLIVEMRLNYCI